MESNAAFLDRIEKDVDAGLRAELRRVAATADPVAAIRRHPGVAMAAGLAAGFAGARLLRGAGGRRLWDRLRGSSGSLLWAFSALSTWARTRSSK